MIESGRNHNQFFILNLTKNSFFSFFFKEEKNYFLLYEFLGAFPFCLVFNLLLRSINVAIIILFLFLNFKQTNKTKKKPCNNSHFMHKFKIRKTCTLADKTVVIVAFTGHCLIASSSKNIKFNLDNPGGEKWRQFVDLSVECVNRTSKLKVPFSSISLCD